MFEGKRAQPRAATAAGARPFPSELPLQNVVVDERRLLTVPWTLFFNGIISRQFYAEGTHQDRIDSNPPNAFPPGALFWETDRTVLYQMRIVNDKAEWVYLTGTMRNTLANIPADLGTNDTGFLFYGTDYIRSWRWSSSAWEYAFGERLEKEILWYPGTVPAGWAVCDGSTITVTTPAAATASFTTPDLTGQFLKGGVYTGLIVNATDGVLSGATDIEASHFHNLTITSGLASAVINVQSGTGASVPSSMHTHDISGGTFAGSAHNHGLSNATVSGGEPAHLLLLPIVKL